MHESLLVPVLMYGSETMIWREKERSRGLLGIRRMVKVQNAHIVQLCRVMKGVDEKVDGVLRCFGHV